MKKYYFITYQAKCNNYESKSIHGAIATFNDVINVSPMQFLKERRSFEELDNTFINHSVTNILEITKEEFEEFELEF